MKAPARHFFAPGRVNLIGEHIDYNGGHVLPCALGMGTYGTIRRRDDHTIRLTSDGFGPTVQITTRDLAFDPSHQWANYVKAVIHALSQIGCVLGGFDLSIKSDLPAGAGLSSSASVMVLTCTALDAVFELQLDTVEIVKLCQRAENDYIGVKCGIMDYFASALCQKDHALLLHCDTLQYRQIPLKLEGCDIVIANTNHPRSLAESKYNQRRAECEQALADLQAVCDLQSLCRLTPQALKRHAHAIKDPVALARATHAVAENARVLDAAEALAKGDWVAFGRLMNASHASLRDGYQVTGPQLDTLTQAAWACDGVLGSRMTGAGFGGCTVSLVQADKTDAFIKRAGETYTAKTGLTADFYVTLVGDGARELFL